VHVVAGYAVGSAKRRNALAKHALLSLEPLDLCLLGTKLLKEAFYERGHGGISLSGRHARTPIGLVVQ